MKLLRILRSALTVRHASFNVFPSNIGFHKPDCLVPEAIIRAKTLLETCHCKVLLARLVPKWLIVGLKALSLLKNGKDSWNPSCGSC